MEKRQRFTAEFKREAVRLLRTSGKPAAVVARELGIPRNRRIKGDGVIIRLNRKRVVEGLPLKV
ncbi:hypothetical protein FHW12_003954 [Dokdonella fugitiva]|uniref:Transposase n=1 Tax=Dokdonella fugitiva TaxID=328517 RepID=A0A839EYB8_9GAMM|nr:hypothetical protein [Dokdonella fugitiva]